MKKTIFLALLISFALAGCSEDKTKSNTAVPTTEKFSIRTGSPDEAVKSWWAVHDEENKIAIDVCREERAKQKKLLSEGVEKVATGNLLAMYKWLGCTTYSYDREIDSVKVESETRGLVFATIKNSTPIPEGITASEYEKESRMNGEKFKYLVEKVDGQWRVSDVYVFDKFNSKGDIWRSVYRDLSKQPYPSYVPENQ
jgi:hypothetical protein